jgi:hypothetical protein
MILLLFIKVVIIGNMNDSFNNIKSSSISILDDIELCGIWYGSPVCH